MLLCLHQPRRRGKKLLAPPSLRFSTGGGGGRGVAALVCRQSQVLELSPGCGAEGPPRAACIPRKSFRQKAVLLLTVDTISDFASFSGLSPVDLNTNH